MPFLFSESRAQSRSRMTHLKNRDLDLVASFAHSSNAFFYIFNGNFFRFHHAYWTSSASEGSIFQNHTVTSQNKSKLFSCYQIVSATIDSVRLTLES